MSILDGHETPYDALKVLQHTRYGNRGAASRPSRA
jgi:hypothetical protein